MTGLVRLVVCGTFLVACTPFAVADSVTVTGNVSFTQDSLTFAPPFATTDTGIFAGFAGGKVDYLLGTVSYMETFSQMTETFTITAANGDVLAFYDQMNTPTKSLDSKGNLQVTLSELGYYTFNGGPAMAGTFDLSFDGTSPDGSTDFVAFSGNGVLLPLSNAAVTPEPSSMFLLGTGLLGSAAMLRRRKQTL